MSFELEELLDGIFFMEERHCGRVLLERGSGGRGQASYEVLALRLLLYTVLDISVELTCDLECLGCE
jgi:hypothetical protein